MSPTLIFRSAKFGEIRTSGDDNGNPLFCLTDLCRILELSNPSMVRSRLNEKGISINDTLTAGGNQRLIYVDESNLYKVVFQSRKPEAEEFTDWVTSEILPSIRKHGGFLTNRKIEEVLSDPDTIIRLATALKTEKQERERLEVEVREQNKALEEAKPKVLFADAVNTSPQSILIGELAKILKQNGIEIGQNRLFQWLRQQGYLCNYGERYNQPTQKAMDLGLFEIKKTTINQPGGMIMITNTTKVTGKGQIYFVNKFLNAA